MIEPISVDDWYTAQHRTSVGLNWRRRAWWRLADGKSNRSAEGVHSPNCVNGSIICRQPTCLRLCNQAAIFALRPPQLQSGSMAKSHDTPFWQQYAGSH
jgi:hypothetical protein